MNKQTYKWLHRQIRMSRKGLQFNYYAVVEQLGSNVYKVSNMIGKRDVKYPVSYKIHFYLTFKNKAV